MNTAPARLDRTKKYPLISTVLALVILSTVIEASTATAVLRSNGGTEAPVHCGSNHRCVEAVARHDCLVRHDRRHCRIMRRWGVAQARQRDAFIAAVHGAAPAPASGFSSPNLADVPGVPASFAACVALRESTDGAGSSNIYGILGPGGQGTLAQQKEAFSQMYAARGAEPWAPYDGC
jgi:hypothetical protein